MMRLTEKQIEIEEALRQITGGLAKLATLAGASTTSRRDILKLAPGVTTADKIVSVKGELPGIGLVVNGPAPKTEKTPGPIGQILAAELKQFLAFRDVCDERAIISAVFDKFHCKNVDMAEILGVPPNMIAKVKMGLRSPTLSTAIRNFMENEK